MFLFREFGAQSPADVVKTVALRLNAQREYARLKPTMDSTVAYAGGGFLRHTSGESAETLIRETVLREPDPGYPCELFDASKAFLARYKALCAEKGSRLIVVLSPNLTAHALAEPGFLPYGESLMRYCRENDIPCFNFQYAKAEYLQNLDGYYYDLYHMNGGSVQRVLRPFLQRLHERRGCFRLVLRGSGAVSGLHRPHHQRLAERRRGRIHRRLQPRHARHAAVSVRLRRGGWHGNHAAR